MKEITHYQTNLRKTSGSKVRILAKSFIRRSDVLSALAPLDHSTSSAVPIKQPPLLHAEVQSEGFPAVQVMTTDLLVAPVIQGVSEEVMT